MEEKLRIAFGALDVLLHLSSRRVVWVFVFYDHYYFKRKIAFICIGNTIGTPPTHLPGFFLRPPHSSVIGWI